MTPSSPGWADRPIVLIGMMGVGKSAVGRRLARRLDREFVDLDRRIELATGRSVAELFDAEGEDGFRAHESEALVEALDLGSNTVISSGGGAVIRRENREVMRQRAAVIWLKARPGTLALRVGTDDRRPLLGADPRAALFRLADERRPWYEDAAHLIVETDRRTLVQVTDEAEQKWSEAGAAGP